MLAFRHLRLAAFAALALTAGAAANSAYALLYAGVAVCAAVVIFERRNLK
jgi:hypothetical protein